MLARMVVIVSRSLDCSDLERVDWYLWDMRLPRSRRWSWVEEVRLMEGKVKVKVEDALYDSSVSVPRLCLLPRARIQQRALWLSGC